MAHVARTERKKREKEERQREEARKRWDEEQRRIEKKRRTELETQAQQWTKSDHLRKFIAEVERRASMQQCSIDFQTRMKEWLTWAKQHADRIDPLKKGLPFETE